VVWVSGRLPAGPRLEGLGKVGGGGTGIGVGWLVGLVERGIQQSPRQFEGWQGEGAAAFVWLLVVAPCCSQNPRGRGHVLVKEGEEEEWNLG